MSLLKPLKNSLQVANQYHEILVANPIPLVVISQVSKGNILQITRNAGFFFFLVPTSNSILENNQHINGKRGDNE